MPKLSAGVLLYRVTPERDAEVLIVHPGGPFWAKKDDGAWSVPKGEYDETEDPWTTAVREFQEELGHALPEGDKAALGEFKQPSGKVITAYAVHADLDVEHTESNTFEMEWPRGSGTMREFPEVDRAGWFKVADARRKLLKGQLSLLDALMELLGRDGVKEGTESVKPEQERLF